MRAAGVLSSLAQSGAPVDRAGSGVVIEVYPAAALKCWGLPHRKYKGSPNVAALDALVGALHRAAPWLEWNGCDALCRTSDDAFDAVICALVARAAARDNVLLPSPQELPAAQTEGWIALPSGSLVGLID
jgi:hypothetical protein